jgi:hypothetical protein
MIMRYLFLLIFLILDLISVTYLLKGRSLANGVVACDPIARVVDNNHPVYRFATPICKDKILQVTQKMPLKVVCRYSPKVVVLKLPTDLSNNCPKTRHNELPTYQNEVVRGNDELTPALLAPYGVTLRETQVMLQWRPEANTAYEITIDDGHGVYRSFNTEKTSLLINSLKPGESYQVTIYSNNSKKSTNVLRILPDNQNKELSLLLKSLDSQKSQITTDDYINIRLALLDKFDLMDESISFLTSQHRKYPGNSEIARALGDLFVKVSRSDLALVSYQYYLDIALYKKNKIDIADAQKRIQYITAQLKL